MLRLSLITRERGKIPAVHAWKGGVGVATHRSLGALFVENFAQKHRPGRASAISLDTCACNPAGHPEAPVRRCNAAACTCAGGKEERGGCQASLPPPPSLGPVAPLVDGDGAIIPRQFFSGDGSLYATDAGTVRSSFSLLLSSLLFPTCFLSSPILPCFPHPHCPSLVPFHCARSASFALVPFPSSFQRSLFASSCSSCPKNDGVEGCAAKRDGKGREQ